MRPLLLLTATAGLLLGAASAVAGVLLGVAAGWLLHRTGWRLVRDH